MPGLDLGLQAFAMSAGIVAFVNPCGFVMLPAYVSYYLGRPEPGSSLPRNLLGGLVLGVTVTIGFVLVFVTAAGLFSLVGRLLIPWIPWVVIATSLILLALGSSMLLGKELHLGFNMAGFLNIDLEERSRFVSFFLYGVGYALASLSCTVPIFLVVVTLALSAGGVVGGLLTFLSYSLGMGVSMTAVSTATALSKNIVMQRARAVIPYAQRIGGIVIILAALYIIYFQVSLGGLLIVL
ncbi:MAG: cytochrome c biogenesis CcdA family protein [Candidatus Geothermarchaeales archaeon]